MKRIYALLMMVILCAVTSMPLMVQAQSDVALQHRAEITRPTHFDKTPKPLREMFDTGERGGPIRGGRDFEPGRPQPVENSNRPFTDPLADKSVGATAAPNILASVGGVPVDPLARVAPPDTTGDVGPNHYVQWVNLRYNIYTLTRNASNEITAFNLVAGFPKNGNVVWQGFGGRCQSDNDGDPIVQYDQLADRWVLTQFAVSGTPFTQCVAVSTSPDPTGTYFRYAFSYNRDFNDYPKMGVWPDAYYITYNIFRNGSQFRGNRVCAFERAQMLLGLSARQACVQTSTAHHSLEPADLEGSTVPPAGSPNLLLSMTSTTINFWRFAVNWGTGTGTLTGPIAVPGVAAFSRACGGGACIPQPGTTTVLDSLADRLMYRLSYRNFGTHEAMVINHAVTSGSGVGIRWYELRNAAGQSFATANPVLHQQGTFAPTNDFRWMGSAAMDQTGGIAIGYNISSASIVPSIRYAFRGPADTLGTLGNETNILVGSGSQNGNLTRWGDYSTISVDPVDGCTMVFTSQFQPATGNFNWSTWIHSFKLSTCN